MVPRFQEDVVRVVGLAAAVLLLGLALVWVFQAPEPPPVEDTLASSSIDGAPGSQGQAPGPALGKAAEGATGAGAGATGAPPTGGNPFGPAPAIIRGTVRGPDSQPIAGLTVHLLGLGASRSVVTDAAGEYRFSGVPPYYSVRLSAAERGLVPKQESPSGMRVEPGRVYEVDLELEEAGSVHGRVLRWDGTPVVGARVWTQGSGLPKAYTDRLVTESAADGSYRLEGLPRSARPVLMSVHAVVEGLPEGSTRIERALQVAGAEEQRPGDPLDVVLARPCYVDVRVIDEETGRGIAGATIHRVPANEFLLGETDADGRCRVGPVTPGRKYWGVSAQGHGALDERLRQELEAAPDVVGEVTFRLHRTRTFSIRGRIVHADGKPADDRRYNLRVLDADGNFRVSQDVWGTFELSRLRRGTYELTVSKSVLYEVLDETDPDAVLGRARVEAGADGVVITLRSNRPVDLAVVVTRRDGRPLEQAAVLARTGNEMWDIGVWDPIRTTDGVVTLTGLTDPVWVEVMPAPGSGLARKRVGPIPPGTPRIEVQLESGHALTGVVVGERGQPFEGVTVHARPVVPEAEGARFGGQHTHGMVHTGPDGRFAFDRLWDGAYRLAFEVPDTHAAPDGMEVAAGSTDVRVKLRKRVTMSVPIQDAAGRPAPGATVFLKSPPYFREDAAIRATTDAEGIAQLDGVDPGGRYVLDVRPYPAVEEARRLWQPGWRPSTNPVRLPGAWALRGRVLGPDGKPASGVGVVLSPTTGGRSRTTRCDEHGRFQQGHLPFESFQLHATHPEGWTVDRPIVVEPGGPEVELRLRRYAGRLRVKIRDWKPSTARPGQTPIRAVVWCPEAPWMRRRARVSTDGTVDVEGLDPARSWTLAVCRWDLDATVRVENLRADGVVREVEARPARVIRGRVLAPDGIWPDRVVVVETGWYFKIQDDGTYEIEHHPPGPWTLDAVAGRPRGRVHREVVVDGDTARDIDFGR